MKAVNLPKIIADHKSSNKSVQAFCRDTGVSPHAFYYHREKLRSSKTSNRSKSKNSQKNFVEVCLLENSEKSHSRSHLMIELLDNGEIAVEGRGDPRYFFTLLSQRAIP